MILFCSTLSIKVPAPVVHISQTILNGKFAKHSLECKTCDRGEATPLDTVPFEWDFGNKLTVNKIVSIQPTYRLSPTPNLVLVTNNTMKCSCTISVKSDFALSSNSTRLQMQGTLFH